MKLTSQAFTNDGKIPDKYTKYGDNLIPPLHFESVPDKARSLALLVDDPDAPKGTFNHWLLFNVDPRTHDIKEGTVPVMATQGQNDYGEIGYGGPQPPSGEHHYMFKAFALDTVLPLARNAKRQEFEREIKGHVIDTATLVGKYARG